MTHLVVVGGRGWVLREALRSAQERGCLVTLVQEHRHVRDDYARTAHEVCPVDSLRDVDEVERVVRDAHQRTPVDSIFSLMEYGLMSAALVAERLALPTSVSPVLVDMLRDKGALRDFLRTCDARFHVGHAVVSSAPEAEAALARVGLPVVVKPTSAAGSLGVTVARTRAEVREAFESARLVCSEVVVEEYLEGPEFSVEAFSHRGRHLVAAITRKHVASSLVEIGHVIPGATGDDEESIRHYVSDFLSAIGLTDGSSHTEIIVTARGPRIVETHNRQGGDSIPLLVLHSTGISLPDLEIASRAHDPAWTLPGEAIPQQAAAITFWASERAGTVVAQPAVAGLYPEQQEVTLTADLGDRVEPLLHSTDRLGWVITLADSPRDAYSRGEDVVRRHPFAVETDLGDDPRRSRSRRLRQYAAEAR